MADIEKQDHRLSNYREFATLVLDSENATKKYEVPERFKCCAVDVQIEDVGGDNLAEVKLRGFSFNYGGDTGRVQSSAYTRDDMPSDPADFFNCAAVEVAVTANNGRVRIIFQACEPVPTSIEPTTF